MIREEQGKSEAASFFVSDTRELASIEQTEVVGFRVDEKKGGVMCKNLDEVRDHLALYSGNFVIDEDNPAREKLHFGKRRMAHQGIDVNMETDSEGVKKLNNDVIENIIKEIQEKEKNVEVVNVVYNFTDTVPFFITDTGADFFDSKFYGMYIRVHKNYVGDSYVVSISSDFYNDGKRNVELGEMMGKDFFSRSSTTTIDYKPVNVNKEEHESTLPEFATENGIKKREERGEKFFVASIDLNDLFGDVLQKYQIDQLAREIDIMSNDKKRMVTGVSYRILGEGDDRESFVHLSFLGSGYATVTKVGVDGTKLKIYMRQSYLSTPSWMLEDAKKEEAGLSIKITFTPNKYESGVPSFGKSPGLDRDFADSLTTKLNNKISNLCGNKG